MLIYIGPRRATALLKRVQGDSRLPPLQTRTYPWLYRTRRLPAATYIFVGVDRLDPGERRLAGQFFRHINALGPGFRALNDPAVAMGRFRLLRTLHERGLNDFNAYLASSGERPERYPVFVRRNSSSVPPLTGLIDSADQLQDELDRLVRAGEVPEDLVIIETAFEPIEPGLYRKYGVHRFGEAYVPAPSMYDANWMVKSRTMVPVSRQHLDFDLRLLQENPLRDFASQVFEIAGIEYGRADIGMYRGRPQVFEVNFNPDILFMVHNPTRVPEQRPAWHRQDDMVAEAIRALDAATGAASIRSARTITTSELTAFRLRFWRNYAPQRF